jgi:hypothetical protein
VENPSNAKGKNHGHQPATISLSQEFWVTRLWRLTRESSLQETLTRVYMLVRLLMIIDYILHVDAPAQPSAFTGLRFAPSEAGLYLAVNLEQLQQHTPQPTRQHTPPLPVPGRVHPGTASVPPSTVLSASTLRRAVLLSVRVDVRRGTRCVAHCVVRYDYFLDVDYIDSTHSAKSTAAPCVGKI